MAGARLVLTLLLHLGQSGAAERDPGDLLLQELQISLKGGAMYEPDFVVEATDVKYLVEVKRPDQLSADDVVEKADAASVWCKHATQHASPDGRPWRYLLLPADVILENRSLKILANEHEYRTAVSTLPSAEPAGAKVLPFRLIRGGEVIPFVNAVPKYDLKIAAGRFSAEQVVDGVPQVGEVTNPEGYEWAALEGRTKPARGLFVAQVVGESMNKRIPNGAWCVWRLHPAGSRQGKVVLAMHRDIQDPDLGAGFTVKVYESEKEDLDDGSWQHSRIVLKPLSTDPSFKPIVLEGLQDGDLVIVAEMVEVLG